MAQLNTDFFKKKPLLQPPDLAQKLQGSFDSSKFINPNQSQEQDQEEPQYDTDTHDSINKIIDEPLKSAVAMRLQNLLSSYPTPEQYKPTKKRRVLGAVLGGLTGLAQGSEAGVKLAREIVDQPYKKALEGWEAKYKPTEASYNLEAAANKDKYGNLKTISDILHTERQDDPRHVAAIEGAKVNATEPVLQRGRLALEGVRQTGETGRTSMNINATRQNTQDTIENENLRANFNQGAETGRNTANITSREKIAKLDRASQERMKQWELDARREADSNSRIPPLDQIHARQDSEDRLISGTVPNARYTPMTKAEKDGITEELKDKDGKHVAWVFKAEADLTDPKMVTALRDRKAQVNELMDDMLHRSFSKKSNNVDSTNPYETNFKYPPIKQ